MSVYVFVILYSYAFSSSSCMSSFSSSASLPSSSILNDCSSTLDTELSYLLPSSSFFYCLTISWVPLKVFENLLSFITLWFMEAGLDDCFFI